MRSFLIVLLTFFLSDGFTQDSTNYFNPQRRGFYKKPSPFKYSNWSISSNLTSPLRELIVSNSYARRYGFSDNIVLTVEPEYRLNDKFSVKFPFRFGARFKKFPFEQIIDVDSWGESSGWMYDGTPDANGIPAPRLWGIWYEKGYPHGRNLIAQIGINPKLYPNGQVKNALYIGLGVHGGISDFYQVDYYHTLDTSTYYGRIVEERAEVSTNYGFYFRFEGMIGMDFNFSKSICLSIETGYTSVINNTGNKPDNVYARINNGEYQPVYSGVYEDYHYTSWYNHMFNRIYLVYRFGGELKKPGK